MLTVTELIDMLQDACSEDERPSTYVYLRTPDGEALYLTHADPREVRDSDGDNGLQLRVHSLPASAIEPRKPKTVKVELEIPADLADGITRSGFTDGARPGAWDRAHQLQPLLVNAIRSARQ